MKKFLNLFEDRVRKIFEVREGRGIMFIFIEDPLISSTLNY